MNIINYFTKPNYINGLIVALGISFQLSMATTNIFFYLLAISGLFLGVQQLVEKNTSHCRALLTSPLWWCVTIWVLLLFLSVGYSEAGGALGQYLRKYVKYLLLGCLVLLALQQMHRGHDIARRFFLGFMMGGCLTFLLSLLNKATGWLTLAAMQGWVSMRYVHNDYWVSIDWFANSLFMAILVLFGVMQWIRSRAWYAILCIAVGGIGVFVMSTQRTGFIVLLVVLLWLLWCLLPSIKQKMVMLVSVILVATMLLSVDNGISQRIWKGVNEWHQCEPVVTQKTVDTQVLGEACWTSIGLRMFFLRSSLLEISEDRFLGRGIGDLSLKAITYNSKTKQYYYRDAQNPHNEYLLQGLQLGIMGVVLLIMIFITAFYQSMKLSRKRKYLYASIVLMYAIGCLFNSFLFDAMESLFFVILLAFVIAEHLHQREQELS